MVEVVVDERGADRDEDDVDDLHHHFEEGDLDVSTGEELHPEGGEDRCEQGARGGNGDGEGDVAAGDVGHDIGGQAAGAGANEDDAGGDFGGEREEAGEGV